MTKYQFVWGKMLSDIVASMCILDLCLIPMAIRNPPLNNMLTHWGRVTHICVGNLTIIGSDNVLSPDRRQAIIWTNAGILLIGPLGTNFIEMLIEIHTFSFKKMHLKMSFAKWRPSCLGLNVLKKRETLSQLAIYLYVQIESFHFVLREK